MNSKKEKFKSPFDQYKEHNGKEFEVIRPLTDKEIGDKDEVGEMYLIKLETGEEIQAFPEEIFEQ